MSEVKVNKISPRTNCGTVTLGDSGDTFTIPAGVSITNSGTASGFGATGAASWNTTVKTGDFTAISGEGYFVNTTSGEIDVTLPAGSPGAVVAVKDYAKTWDTNNCIIISNGSEKIGGSTNNATLSTEGLAVTFIYIDSTQGWLVTDDGNQNVAVTNPFIEATGGTETTSGNCKIHTFTGPGTFSVTKLASCSANNIISHMVVAGGGGGGAVAGGSYAAGGGGAGGFREVKSPITPYTASPLDGYPNSPNRVTVTVTDFPITVGGGGAAGPNSSGTIKGTSGANSIFSTITSAGGGGGGAGANPASPGANGGSGGGSGGFDTPYGCGSGGTGNTPPVTPSQGNNGGIGTAGHAPGGGGGGATTAGTNSSPGTSNPRAGGTGAATSITASPVTYSAGGPSGNYPGTPAPNASDNTGNGGGGGGGNSPGTSGNGGSGIVVIRYKFQ
jgi:hypothetical protein